MSVATRVSSSGKSRHYSLVTPKQLAPGTSTSLHNSSTNERGNGCLSEEVDVIYNLIYNFFSLRHQRIHVYRCESVK